MKDPAVLFYTSDFLSGVSFFNMEQRGQYITLLCEQHQHGSIPENHMINICGSLDSPVIKKFIKDENGNYYQERMRLEAEKRKSYCESRKNNKSGRKKNKSYDKHMINHMGNENINENINININEFKEKVFSFKEYDQKMLNEFFDYWTEKNKSGKKMRFEEQKFFDIKKRLARWKLNQKENFAQKENKINFATGSSYE